MSMTQLPRPIGMPATLAVYSASSRPCAAATRAASAARTAAVTQTVAAKAVAPAPRAIGFDSKDNNGDGSLSPEVTAGANRDGRFAMRA
jgi:hypothetical protein